MQGWREFYRLAMRVYKDVPKRGGKKNTDNYPPPRKGKPIIASGIGLRRRPVRWHVCSTGE